MSFWDNFSQLAQQASQVFNATYAKQFYAQQANLAFQSGLGNNWAMASAWDAVGGFVALGTGSPQSPGQSLWSIALSVPIVGGQSVIAAISAGLSTAMGTTSAISNAFNSIASGTPMSLPDWASGMIGLGGGLIGARGDAFLGLSESLLQLGTQARGDAQLLLAAAAQKAANAGQVLNAAANGIALGGFVDSTWQTITGLKQEVGGVLFNHCDTVLTGIDEIVGAYWDDKSRSIVLFGKPDAGGKRPYLPIPALDADHIKVALRAAIAGQPLGVSIDPPADYRYGKKSTEMLPDRTPLLVSYLGNTAGTLFGAIMFESDRIMKCLSVGLENKTRTPFASHVPGFHDLFSTSGNSKPDGTASWHRFWFVIDSVKLVKSSHSDAVIVGDVQIKVLTELEMPNAPKGRAIDQNDRAFAEHLTKNYDAYAREFPVFARLKELAKVSAIARFLVAQNIPVDLDKIFQGSSNRVTTPETTASILRIESSSNRTHLMSGGVDFDVQPEILPDLTGNAEKLHHAVAAARKSSASVWSVPVAARSLEARSIPLTAQSGFRHTVTDYHFPSLHGVPSPIVTGRNFPPRSERFFSD